MRTAVTIWAMPGGVEGRADLVAASAAARQAGFDALELSLEPGGTLDIDPGSRELDNLRTQLQDSGTSVSSLSALYLHEHSFTVAERSVREAARRFARRIIRIASALSVPTVSWGPGSVDAATTYDHAYEVSVETMRDLGSFARDHGVVVCVENVNRGLLLSPREFAGYLKDVDLPSVGACLDVGNAMLNGFPLHWFDSLGERIHKVHLTDTRLRGGQLFQYVELGDGDAPLVDVVRRASSLPAVDILTVEAFHRPGEDPLARLLDINARVSEVLSEASDGR